MTGWTWLKRQWLGGHRADLALLLSSLVLCVGIVAGIGLFGSRLGAALDAQTKTFLAGELALKSNKPIPSGILERASELGLRSSHTTEFTTMVYSEDESRYALAGIKAVSSQYPLLGVIETEADGHLIDAVRGPAMGQVWLSPRLMRQLQLKLGDDVFVGEAKLNVNRIIHREPDGGFAGFSFAPRVMMNSQDIYATESIQPGSRITYRRQFEGDDQLLTQLQDEYSSHLPDSVRWVSIEDGQPALFNALERAQQFLLICGALAVALGGVTLAFSGRRYTRSLYDSVAVMKTIGATPKKITRLVLSKCFWIWFIGTVLGLIAGFLLQAILALLLESLLAAPLPSVQWSGAVLGVVTSLVSMLAFLGPPMWRLRIIPPLRVLRRDLGNASVGLIAYVIGFLGLGGLLIVYTQSPWVVLGLLMALFISALLGLIVGWIIQKLGQPSARAGTAFKLAISSLVRHKWVTVGQIVAFSVTLALLSTAIMTRTDLLDDWQTSLPDNAPNYFFVNIAPHQVDMVETSLDIDGIDHTDLYPITRGRLVEINGKPAAEGINGPDLRHLQRELNLTATTRLPKSNDIQQGRWWNADSKAYEVSVEQMIAEDLHIGLGDQLTFKIGGQSVSVKVTSIRSLDWGRMEPSFYMILSPAALTGRSGSSIASAYIENGDDFVADFVTEFPTISVIDIGFVINQVRQLIDQVSKAVELILILVVAAAVLVLLATIRASHEWRIRESAVLRALGASKRRLQGAILIEYLILGALSGLFAAAMTETTLYVIQSVELDMDTRLHVTLWWLLPLLASFLISAVGLLSNRKVVNTSPMIVLRSVGE